MLCQVKKFNVPQVKLESNLTTKRYKFSDMNLDLNLDERHKQCIMC